MTTMTTNERTQAENLRNALNEMTAAEREVAMAYISGMVTMKKIAREGKAENEGDENDTDRKS